MMRGIRVAAALAVALGTTSCRRPISSGDIIDGYRSAQCVEPTFATGVNPPTRGWDATLVLADGSKVTLTGADTVSGTLVATYEPDGAARVVVPLRDYIYPSDVRIDSARRVLYAKARGSAGGIFRETWLHQYDLQRREPISEALVEPGVLPAECPMPTESK